MQERENIFIRILKRLGIITEYEVSKEDMCKQAQSICNHDCEHCAWQTEKLPFAKLKAKAKKPFRAVWVDGEYNEIGEIKQTDCPWK